MDRRHHRVFPARQRHAGSHDGLHKRSQEQQALFHGRRSHSVGRQHQPLQRIGEGLDADPEAQPLHKRRRRTNELLHLLRYARPKGNVRNKDRQAETLQCHAQPERQGDRLVQCRRQSFLQCVRLRLANAADGWYEPLVVRQILLSGELHLPAGIDRSGRSFAQSPYRKYGELSVCQRA